MSKITKINWKLKKINFQRLFVSNFKVNMELLLVEFLKKKIPVAASKIGTGNTLSNIRYLLAGGGRLHVEHRHRHRLRLTVAPLPINNHYKIWHT